MDSKAPKSREVLDVYRLLLSQYCRNIKLNVNFIRVTFFSRNFTIRFYFSTDSCVNLYLWVCNVTLINLPMRNFEYFTM